ncbi:hypothetical protein PVAND_013574 [Polypedilum vanderplanki]|uniref:N-acetyltransferase domain-containing protein n=1 Tax=Polypedilum vanderplanki TaxID=319348 RepID=A0A9J6CS02_POLVA|nr:hypothetical protein PVAND_013574 [Polypedilum vanderplanki]
MSTFKRPANLEFPKTYYKFNLKNKTTGEIEKYRVQDLPEDRFEDALDLMVNHFLPDEEINISRGLLKSQEGIKEHRELWAEMINQKFSIACFKDDGSNELVGVNVLNVCSKDDIEEKLNIKDDAFSDILALLDYTVKQFDVYKEFKVNSYLTAFGLCIIPAYRGKGIATEMLKARVPILKALNLSVTSTAFTGTASQIAAKKAEYETVYSIKYSDLKHISPRFNFLNTKTEYFKLMALKI